MFDVMIVDDEYPIRESVKHLIPWDELGLRLSCEASDGDSAWELYSAKHPRIIITDINIPFSSGLELAQRISAVDPDVCFIVITGFCEFSSAQNSVKLGVVDLITKPILQDEIIRSLKKAILRLKDRIHEQRRQENLSAMLTESRSMLIESYYSRLLHASEKEERSRISEKLLTLRPEPFHRYCAVALTSLQMQDMDDSDTIMVAAKNLFQKILVQRGFSCFSYFNDHSDLVSILSWEDSRQPDALEHAALQFSERMAFYFNTTALPGIGIVVEDPAALRESYLTALRARNWMEANPQDAVASYQDIEKINLLSVREDVPDIHSIVVCLQSGDTAALSVHLARSFSALSSAGQERLTAARTLALNYTANLISAWTSLSPDPAPIQDCANTLTDIGRAGSPDELKALLGGVTAEMASHYRQKQETNKNTLIALAQQYICENLGDSALSLEQVSRHIGFSSPYFCRLFHREVGLSFNDYLNQVRVEHAKTLLKNPTLKIGEISRLAGYNTPTHFNYIFKRMVGKTPSEYKAIALQTDHQ